MQKKRFHFDMDGVVARFHDSILDVDGCVQIELMYEEDFFRKLSPFQNMIDAIKLFVERHPEVEVYALSAAQLGDPPGFVRQKDEWLNEFLPEIDKEHRIYPECGVAKSSYIPGGLSDTDYLLDDFNKNLNEWIRDGGKAIKCKNNINHKGTGKYGGDVGNLWTGDMVSNLDSPEEILRQLEDFMNLEHKKEKPLNYYEEEYKEHVKDYPDTVIGDFKTEKNRFLKWIDEGEEGPLKIKPERTSFLRKRIDEVVLNYGLYLTQCDCLDSSAVMRCSELAVESTCLFYTGISLSVCKIIDQYFSDGVYDEKQKEYLLENTSDILDAFYEQYDKYCFDTKFGEEKPVLDHGQWMNNAIASVAEKEMLVIEAYPVKDNYPAVEIDISRRDLEKVLNEIYKDEDDWPIQKFLYEYTWDEGEQIKGFLEVHPEFCKDTVNINDFSNAKYTVIITNWHEDNDSKEIYDNSVDVFYPDVIDESFVEKLFKKGYEGYRVLVTDVLCPTWDKVLYDAVLDDSIIECFEDYEKELKSENEKSLDYKIKQASKESEPNCKGKNPDRNL